MCTTGFATGFVVLLIAVLLTPGIARAEGGLGAEASFDFADSYVWRGQVLNDEAVFQPGVTVSFGSFAFGAWGNLDLTDFADNSFQFTEIDYTLSYGFDLANTSFELGVIEYRFPNAAGVGPTHEVYVAVSWREVMLAPSFSIYYDFDEVEGYYANVGISHGVEVPGEHTIDLGLSLGYGSEDYNAAYFGVLGSGANDGNLSASIIFDLGHNLTLTPSLAYSWFLDSEIKNSAQAVYDDDAHLVGMLAVGWSMD